MAKLVRVDRGNWVNSADYIPGDYALDVPTSIIWNCAVMHTSAAAGTFADDRAANPTYWRVALQVIPSELKEFYDGTATPLMPNEVIRGRYPWKMPAMQEGGSGVTDDQKEQRDRWKAIKDKFKDIPWAIRQRWYAARPPWASLLWYYNYFMMSGLMGNAEINGQGGGVIKDINHYTFSLPAGTAPDATIAVDTCDPQKSVPFFFGAGYGIVGTNVPIQVYPYLKSLNSTQMIIGASLPLDDTANLSVTLIEYI